MVSTKTPSRGPRERARKKRAGNQLRKSDFHLVRIEKLEAALHSIKDDLEDPRFGELTPKIIQSWFITINKALAP